MFYFIDPQQEAFDFLESKGNVNIQLECHKVDRVTEASENGKVEWSVTVIEDFHAAHQASQDCQRLLR